MYDPEESFRRQQQAEEDQQWLTRVIEENGVNSYLAQIIELSVDIFNSIRQAEDDIANCFDEAKIQEKEKYIEELLDIVKDIEKHISKRLDETKKRLNDSES